MTATGVQARSGFPLPGVELKITDPDSGAPCRTARSVRSRSGAQTSFKGYWQMPEKTKAELREDGFFITGDLGKIDTDGYVHIVGREQGPDHFRRLQHLPEGNRADPGRTTRRSGKCRHRCAAYRFR
jgi:acyl-CoA synthetase (AMP-forming)/AMP-acid ligase II